ncbi:hypothetical protein SMACR_05249 [Sordaria macrospora]|uniref:WGS project CABT00000000 data, contig 2.8 n=2 Tax=Sordaria macrospora TaxID=5147 RepID=F7VUY9_SORMK|nr:uncharacterized protein SMAC_05249 [Sordaria macrospora k-hell]KAA8632663.1 hypothetical protein SMACR_05249 [Sordaria macrospora]KAH7628709.1 hypothetical protein B0T09DRAFT_166314 [Sordaria sp. MPI-SDFR-AT-0083]WPJ57364.1 hypothetical protein SMAC4_05249 [Sordaria macrospora]CCC09335.1 unnamed protein product [Sordaria macrospora k-hell]
MSDPTSPSPSAHLEETLGRLSKKPGVKGAMVLDRASGAILKTSGQISSIRKAKPQPQQPEQSEPVTDQQGPLSPSFPPGATTDTTTTDAGAAPGTAVTTTGEEAVAAQPTMVSSGTGMDGDVPGAGAGASAAAAGARSASTSGSNAVSAYDQNVVELAAMVWSFVSNAGEFVQELDGEDELKLLRLRTKKQELVIVPDAKYLLVVFHDTPPA